MNIAFLNKSLLLFVTFYLLVGCTKTIDANEAEKIAIETAIAEGYTNPRLFTKYNSGTTQGYKYSVEENKDIRTWKVILITDEREWVEGMLGDLIYYIDIKNGKIVDKISGVD